MIEDFTESTEAQGLEIHPDKTKILTNQKTDKLREIDIDEMHVEIRRPEGKVQYLEQMVGNHRGATQNPVRMVRIRETSTGTDIPMLLATTPITPVRRCCHQQ